MIKFKKTAANGKQLLGLGLSAENIKRLQNNDPILFDLGELGIEGYDVLIFAGETEESIITEFQEKGLIPNAED